MPVETKMKIDGGSLTKYSDGRVTLGGRSSCFTWGLLITIGLATLGSLAMTVSVLFRNLISALELFGITVFLGFCTWFLFNSLKRGMTVLDSNTKSLRFKKREIPFSEIETTSNSGAELPMMEGAILITFYANLSSGESIVLGSISGDGWKIASRVEQVQSIIDQTIKG